MNLKMLEKKLDKEVIKDPYYDGYKYVNLNPNEDNSSMNPDSGVYETSFQPSSYKAPNRRQRMSFDARSFCTRMPDYDPVLGRLGRKLKGHKMSFERGMRRFEIKQYRAEERRRDHFLSKSMNCLPESG